MNLVYYNNKITYVIDTRICIGFEYKGSSFALHALAYELAKMGSPVYVFNEPMFNHPNIFIIKTERQPVDDGWVNVYNWESFNFDINKTVSIYSQISWGNPFNTKNNARWILHHCDDEIISKFNDDDILFNYSNFNVGNKKVDKELIIFDYKKDNFYNQKDENRQGFCHILHKNTPEWGIKFLDNMNSTEIPHHNGQKNIDYLLSEFNKYEYFITFDDKSYYSLIATLCGTKVIIANNNNYKNPLDFRLDNPLQLCGIAYGFNDIKWADTTIDLVRNHIENIESLHKQTVIDFNSFWENKLLHNEI